MHASIRSILTAAFTALAALPAAAQDWPTRNVTVVVPLGAGSANIPTQ
jgi:tripartite-type tricarboxylate transporter receptor subunit TctC